MLLKEGFIVELLDKSLLRYRKVFKLDGKSTNRDIMMSEIIYEPGTRGKCPHCQHAVLFEKAEPKIIRHVGPLETRLGTTSGGVDILVYASKCPNCEKPIVAARIKSGKRTQIRLVYPFNIARIVPDEVPEHIKQDFLEAAAVLPISEKASAALARRCLQNLLIDQGAPEKATLSEQIDWAIERLPGYLAENLDYIRVVGNFAAHPIKSKNTGMIVDVEPEEASWTLDVLEMLFDFYYVRPKIAKEKRERLEQKLREVGKPPLKRPKED